MFDCARYGSIVQKTHRKTDSCDDLVMCDDYLKCCLWGNPVTTVVEGIGKSTLLSPWFLAGVGGTVGIIIGKHKT